MNQTYDGVRVFFNSMLKECMPIANLSREIEKSFKVVSVAIHDKNANIFTFLCDCLDMSLDKVDIRQILSSNAFRLNSEDNKHRSFDDTLSYKMYKQNHKVFERFISYYDEDTDETEVKHILSDMLYGPLDFFKDSKCIQKDQEIQNKVELVLCFLGRSREASRQISDSNFEKRIRHILTIFFYNEYYDRLLRQFLELLSSAFIENKLLQNFLMDTFKIQYGGFSYGNPEKTFIIHHCKDFSDGNLEKTLAILRDLGREEVLQGISRQILKTDIQSFKQFYQPNEKEETTKGVLLPTNFQSLLVRDSYRMTPLHRAALYDNEATVNRILEMVRICCSSPDIETQNMGKEVLYNVIANDEEGVTPLYVAAACEHETICKQMFIFLKEMLPEDELRKYLTETNGFLYNALQKTMKLEKIQMFRKILISVQEFLGQDYLIALMKAHIPVENS
jgi:hypothetical protein